MSELRVDSEVDVLGILAVLVEHGVDFVVIGGVAVAAHGFVRATKDVDIVPNPGPANLTRLMTALEKLDAKPVAIRDFRREELPVELTAESLALGGNCDLTTKHGRLDVMQYIAGALESPADFDELRERGIVVDLRIGPVRFAGYEDLIDLKHIAGRETDLIDIRALREARRDTGP